MGTSTSRLIECEKRSWIKNHTLDINPAQAKEQQKLLPCFGSKLYLCFKEETIIGFVYKHWFVTDGSWYIEFGEGELLSCTVIVHPNPKPKYDIDKTFKLTDAVKERMQNVCGATNYSLILRNSEHVARYIQCGSWISLQTAGEGTMKKELICYMTKEHTKYINTMPWDLKKDTPRNLGPLYPQASRSITYEGHKNVLTPLDNELHNILLLGPTGCGKSSLINLLFNQNVVDAGASATSLTREITFVQGSALFAEWRDKSLVSKKHGVNLIDTIGFCDSEFSEVEIFDYIKDKLKTNLLHIDRVVIVCSGRLEKEHQKSIKKFMQWLKYDTYKRNFCFIYSKCDGMDEGKKLALLNEVCGMLGIDTSVTLGGIRVDRPMVNALGFHPKASYDDIIDDVNTLLNTTCEPTCEMGTLNMDTRIRIPMNSSICTIL